MDPIPTVLFLLASLTFSGASAADDERSGLRDMFNAMQQLLTGDPVYFDTAYLDELEQCWDQIHPDLKQTQV